MSMYFLAVDAPRDTNVVGLFVKIHGRTLDGARPRIAQVASRREHGCPNLVEAGEYSPEASKNGSMLWGHMPQEFNCRPTRCGVVW